MTTKQAIRTLSVRAVARRPIGRAVAPAAFGVILIVASACSSSGSSTAGASGSPRPSAEPTSTLRLTSTLDGHSVLPHRIHWEAQPRPAGEVTEVDFLIDGKLAWVEHNPPFDYGDDGNYLVTSFLHPGEHEFTVRAINVSEQTVQDSVTARVSRAPRPPSALAGTWKGFHPHGALHGYASLVINQVGWYIGAYPVDHQGGNLVDVAYPAPGVVEIRTGMATGHDTVAGKSVDDDLNGWCNNAPGSPVRYRWSVSGSQLRLTYVKGLACVGFTKFLSVPWRHVG